MIAFLRFCKHAIAAVWRHESGRWFYFRDTPYDVVAEVAALDSGGIEDELHDMIMEARRELERRKQQHERTI